MSSVTYWNVASAVQERLNALSAIGNEMQSNLESNDDPAEIADFLDTIETRLILLTKQIGPNVLALRKVAKALDDIPGIQ